MLDAGELLPDMLVPDVAHPNCGVNNTRFNEDFSGAIEAKKSIGNRSLNIPAVRLLTIHGLQKFRDQLDVFE